MKKLFLLFVLCLAAVLPASAGMGISAGTGAHTHSDANTGGGTLTLSGTLSSTKACATGFTRVTPNFCQADAVGSASSVGACALNNAIAGASDVKAVLFRVESVLVTANSVALRTALLVTYAPTDTTCTTALINQDWTAREEVAAAATTLSRNVGFFISRTNTSGQTYHAATRCASCTVSLFIAGYLD